MLSYKEFMAGKKGYSHSAQEFGAYAIITSLAGWLVSPILAVILMGLIVLFAEKVKLPMMSDIYWFNREIQQSINMGRRPSPADFDQKTILQSDFWTADAVDDVKFPRKTRNLFRILALIYSWIIFSITGFYGLVF